MHPNNKDEPTITQREDHQDVQAHVEQDDAEGFSEVTKKTKNKRERRRIEAQIEQDAAASATTKEPPKPTKSQIRKQQAMAAADKSAEQAKEKKEKKVKKMLTSLGLPDSLVNSFRDEEGLRHVSEILAEHVSSSSSSAGVAYQAYAQSNSEISQKALDVFDMFTETSEGVNLNALIERSNIISKDDCVNIVRCIIKFIFKENAFFQNENFKLLSIFFNRIKHVSELQDDDSLQTSYEKYLNILIQGNFFDLFMSYYSQCSPILTTSAQDDLEGIYGVIFSIIVESEQQAYLQINNQNQDPIRLDISEHATEIIQGRMSNAKSFVYDEGEYGIKIHDIVRGFYKKHIVNNRVWCMGFISQEESKLDPERQLDKFRQKFHEHDFSIYQLLIVYFPDLAEQKTKTMLIEVIDGECHSSYILPKFPVILGQSPSTNLQLPYLIGELPLNEIDKVVSYFQGYGDNCLLWDSMTLKPSTATNIRLNQILVQLLKLPQMLIRDNTIFPVTLSTIHQIIPELISSRNILNEFLNIYLGLLKFSMQISYSMDSSLGSDYHNIQFSSVGKELWAKNHSVNGEVICPIIILIDKIYQSVKKRADRTIIAKIKALLEAFVNNMPLIDLISHQLECESNHEGYHIDMSLVSFLLSYISFTDNISKLHYDLIYIVWQRLAQELSNDTQPAITIDELLLSNISFAKYSGNNQFFSAKDNFYRILISQVIYFNNLGDVELLEQMIYKISNISILHTKSPSKELPNSLDIIYSQILKIIFVCISHWELDDFSDTEQQLILNKLLKIWEYICKQMIDASNNKSQIDMIWKKTEVLENQIRPFGYHQTLAALTEYLSEVYTTLNLSHNADEVNYDFTEEDDYDDNNLGETTGQPEKTTEQLFYEQYYLWMKAYSKNQQDDMVFHVIQMVKLMQASHTFFDRNFYFPEIVELTIDKILSFILKSDITQMLLNFKNCQDIQEFKDLSFFVENFKKSFLQTEEWKTRLLQSSSLIEKLATSGYEWMKDLVDKTGAMQYLVKLSYINKQVYYHIICNREITPKTASRNKSSIRPKDLYCQVVESFSSVCKVSDAVADETTYPLTREVELGYDEDDINSTDGSSPSDRSEISSPEEAEESEAFCQAIRKEAALIFSKCDGRNVEFPHLNLLGKKPVEKALTLVQSVNRSLGRHP